MVEEGEIVIRVLGIDPIMLKPYLKLNTEDNALVEAHSKMANEFLGKKHYLQKYHDKVKCLLYMYNAFAQISEDWISDEDKKDLKQASKRILEGCNDKALEAISKMMKW